MGKLSVNLPDPLENQLRQYADAHQMAVSGVVTQALQAFFEPSPSPPPPPPADPVRDYVVRLADQVEGIRRVVYRLAGYVSGALNPIQKDVPPQLPTPPWSHSATYRHLLPEELLQSSESGGETY